jgi:hypothetical protein
MTRRARTALAVVVALAIGGLTAGAWWRARGAGGGDGDERAAIALPAKAAPATPARPGDVAITGRVIDVQTQRPIGGVEVVFRGAAGDAATTARSDGSYAIRVAPGRYRAFIRDDVAMSFGRRDPPRLPGPPPADVAGVPDEGLMATVVATADIAGVDLSVVRGGKVLGRVVDRIGRPIVGAVVQAAGAGVRPVLATDIAVSADDGSFALRVPPGSFELTASHPRFAGPAEDSRRRYTLSPGQRTDATVIMTAGCEISGRVVRRDGEPAGDGALERQWGRGEFEFAPAGRIDPDGGFHWVTTERDDIALRAWPWQAPPSPIRRFACRDGARFDGVVLRLPERSPAIEGTLVAPTGVPIGFAFIDVKAIDADGVGQQERSDVNGGWSVHDAPPGRYRLIARVDGAGIAVATVTSPRTGVRLELSGTGRLDGTAPRMASGSFDLVLDSCTRDGEQIPLPQSRRLVTVTGGRFSVGDVPACELSATALWRGRPLAIHTNVPRGGAARIELAVGDPHDKTVRGQVRDAAGAAVAGAVVSVARPDDDARAATAVSDAAGGFAIKAFSGAVLSAAAHGQVGYARVGAASIDSERLDVTLGDTADAPEPEPEPDADRARSRTP